MLVGSWFAFKTKHVWMSWTVKARTTYGQKLRDLLVETNLPKWSGQKKGDLLYYNLSRCSQELLCSVSRPQKKRRSCTKSSETGWKKRSATSSNHLRKRIGENKIWCIFGTLNVLLAGGLCTNKSESFRWAPVGLTNQTSLGLEWLFCTVWSYKSGLTTTIRMTQ